MKLRGLFGSVVAGLAAVVGAGKAALSPPKTHRRDFTMPLTLPSRRTAPRHRRGRRTAEQRQLKHERRKASIPARVWHTGPVRSVRFKHETRSARLARAHGEQVRAQVEDFMRREAA